MPKSKSPWGHVYIRIDDLMDERHWTVAQAARACHLSRQTIYTLRDHLFPLFDSLTLAKLCHGFGVEVEDLIFYAND